MNRMQWVIDSLIIIGVMLLVANPLACHLDNKSSGATPPKYTDEVSAPRETLVQVTP